MMLSRKQSRKSLAFTLIEMMVVIFILGILVAMVVGISRYVFEESARKETETTQAVLMGIIDAFHEQFEKYPPDQLDPINNAAQGDKPLEPSAAIISDMLQCRDANDITDAQCQFITGAVPQPGHKPRLAQQIKAISMDRLLKLPEEAIGDEASDFVFLDGWGKAMRYSRNGGLGDRPVLISAGPDGQFGWDAGEEPSLSADNVRSDGR